MTEALQVRIIGRVQGVGYRAWTIEAATRRGLDGWVRNRRDGSVEAVFSGPHERVVEMLAGLWQGPPASHVDSVRSVPAAAPVAPGFRGLPTL